MTVHRTNEDSRESCYPVVSPCSKNHWPRMDNDSSSWDRNSRATSSSWPSDMEEAATRRVLQIWDAIERKLFEEDEQVPTLDPIAEECHQWRTQLVHLRIIGRNPATIASQESIDPTRSTSRRSIKTSVDRFGDEIIVEDSLYKIHDSGDDSGRRERLVEDQNEVFEQILEFVCTELSKRKDDQDVDKPSGDLDEVLRITPAPTYSARKTIKGRKKRDSGESRKSSASENRAKIDSIVTGDENNRTASANKRITKNSFENEVNNAENEDEDVPQVARNKLGTIFNEKIVVSPVPFVVSTRESFTTLRTTPISFRAQTLENSTPQGIGRYMNSASKINSAQRMSGGRLPQSHSAWQAPVCPTVWPKNVRLAPIDPARLPSSKNRSSAEPSGLPQRARNSLSPITRSAKPVQSANPTERNFEGLEIQGKQIVSRSSKLNLRKTACSPRNGKNTRTRARARNDRQ